MHPHAPHSSGYSLGMNVRFIATLACGVSWTGTSSLYREGLGFVTVIVSTPSGTALVVKHHARMPHVHYFKKLLV